MILWSAPVSLLLLSIPQNLGLAVYPRGYFDFLSLVVTVAAGLLAHLRLKRDMRDNWGWGFVAVALLYNPVWPPTFDAPFWLVFNLAGAAIFVLAGRRITNPSAHAAAFDR